MLTLAATSVCLVAALLSARLLDRVLGHRPRTGVAVPDGPADGEPGRVGTTTGHRTDVLRRLRRRFRQVTRRSGPPLASAAATASWADDVARRLRAGHTLGSAIASVEPDDVDLADAVRPLRRDLTRGDALRDALDATARHSWQGPLAMVAVTLDALTSVGGGAAIPLERLAGALRLRSADGQERAAQSAQARLSSHVLTVVPVATLGLLCVTDPDVRHVTTSTTGVALVGAGLALNAVGWWWMRRTIGVTP